MIFGGEGGIRTGDSRTRLANIHCKPKVPLDVQCYPDRDPAAIAGADTEAIRGLKYWFPWRSRHDSNVRPTV